MDYEHTILDRDGVKINVVKVHYNILETALSGPVKAKFRQMFGGDYLTVVFQANEYVVFTYHDDDRYPAHWFENSIWTKGTLTV